MARYRQAFKDRAAARLLPEAGKNAWRREKGVYPAQLKQWLADATAALAAKAGRAARS